MLGAFLATLLSAAPAPEPPACRPVLLGHFRDESPERVILRSTPDSVLVGHYRQTPRGLTRVAASDDGSIRVYGQIFELRSASGPSASLLASYQRVVVIWWGHGGACERAAPRKAVQLERSELFLTMAPGPRSGWAGGLPTFDMPLGGVAWLYYPGMWHDPATLRPMTVTDYAELHELLPASGMNRAQTLEASEAVLRWGAEDPTRWRLSPARGALCQAGVSGAGGAIARRAAALLAEHCAYPSSRTRRQ